MYLAYPTGRSTAPCAESIPASGRAAPDRPCLLYTSTYGTDEFAVCNVALSATKAIRFSDRFQLPVFTRLIWNPAMDDVHFVGGLSIML